MISRRIRFPKARAARLFRSTTLVSNALTKENRRNMGIFVVMMLRDRTPELGIDLVSSTNHPSPLHQRILTSMFISLPLIISYQTDTLHICKQQQSATMESRGAHSFASHAAHRPGQGQLSSQSQACLVSQNNAEMGIDVLILARLGGDLSPLEIRQRSTTLITKEPQNLGL